MNDDHQTPAEHAAAKQILAAYLKRRQDAQDAQGPNPLQEPRPRYPAGTTRQGHGEAEVAAGRTRARSAEPPARGVKSGKSQKRHWDNGT